MSLRTVTIALGSSAARHRLTAYHPPPSQRQLLSLLSIVWSYHLADQVHGSTIRLLIVRFFLVSLTSVSIRQPLVAFLEQPMYCGLNGICEF